MPTTKAHPGLRVADLDACAERLAAHGAPVVWDSSLPPDRRIYCQDPVGNLLEFVGPGGPAGEPVVPGVRGVGTKVKV